MKVTAAARRFNKPNLNRFFPGPSSEHRLMVNRPWALEWLLTPHQSCCKQDQPFIRNTICREQLVHQPIVGGPAHSWRLTGIGVIGWITSKSQTQLASTPHGSVIAGFSL